MSSENTLRIVMVGCGYMSRVWLDVVAAMPDVVIVGLVDVVEDTARKRADEYNLSRAMISTDLATVFAQTAVDAIFNCTIPEAHYAVTSQALQHGCHVLSEKPLADSMEHARELVALSQRVGKIFSVIQNRRYDLHIRRFQHFLASGALGPLTTVNSDFYLAPHFEGFRAHMRHVLLLDMAIHSFDAARLLIGADPLSVYCKEWNPPGSWYDYDASALAIFEMSNGVVYTYRGSWCADGLPTTWECDWRCIGQRGSATWDGGERYQAQVIAQPGDFISAYEDVEVPPYAALNIGGHAGLIQEFVACIKSGTQPETNAADNIKSLAMALGAIESAEKGLPVHITWD